MTAVPVQTLEEPRAASLGLALGSFWCSRGGIAIAARSARPLALYWFTVHTGREIRVAGDFKLHLLLSASRRSGDERGPDP